MGKTIEELFKTERLADGKTAAEKYDIQNSKNIELSSATSAMNLPFKAVQIARKNLSSRLKETRVEEEVTGLRVISKLGGPIIYGTDIFRLSTQKTDMVTTMKDSVNPSGGDSGLIGNLLNKAKDKGLELASKIGIKFPTTLIPTKISLNSDFKAGKEPDTMTTLAKIKNDAAGNLVGKLLAQNVKGTPKQIGNQILGAGIDLLKKEVKKKLFGAPKQGAQNLAKKGEYETQYDSSAVYSSTVDQYNEEIGKRNDLSSFQQEKIIRQKKNENDAVNRLLENSKLKFQPKDLPVPTPNLGGKLNLDTARFNIGGKVSSITDSVKNKLSGARKQGQNLISSAKLKIGDIKPETPAEVPAAPITYSETVDETTDDIKLRNDLSTKLAALNEASQNLKEGKTTGTSVERAGTYSVLNNSKKPAKTLRTKLGIDSKLDFLNEKTSYTITKDNSENGSLKLKDKTLLDDYDFITLKFSSIATGQTVNFRATLSGVSETISPSWDNQKFLGSPFNTYTYNSIERSLSFNFKVYSTSPIQHIAAWQRLNFLTSLAYPQGFNKATFIPPFIKLTLGNLYKNRECFIESLSYTIDDNTPWEVGPIGDGADNAKYKINGQETSIDNYKLPTIIDVNITVKLLESKGKTSLGNYYGFDKLPRTKNKDGGFITQEIKSDNPELSGDANNTEVLEQIKEVEVPPQPVENVTNENAPAVNAGANTSTTKDNSGGVENTKAPEVPKPINYKITANPKGDGFTGNVYADGKLIVEQSYWSGFAYFYNGKEMEGLEAVKESLKGKAKSQGFYADGKFYDASDNVN